MATRVLTGIYLPRGYVSCYVSHSVHCILFEGDYYIAHSHPGFKNLVRKRRVTVVRRCRRSISVWVNTSNYPFTFFKAHSTKKGRQRYTLIHSMSRRKAGLTQQDVINNHERIIRNPKIRRAKQYK